MNIETKKRGRPALGRANQSITLTINKELHDKVKDYALTQERSISFITKKALEVFLDANLKK
jgi:predicted transcriptional regulator